MKSEVKRILNALRHLKEMASTNQGLYILNHEFRTGICESVATIIMDTEATQEYSHITRQFWEATCTHAFVEWSGYSQVKGYPVNVNKKYEPCDEYHRAYQQHELWGDTPYGRARLRLLDHTIEYFEGLQ